MRYAILITNELLWGQENASGIVDDGVVTRRRASQN